MNSASQRAKDVVKQLTIQWIRGWQAYFVAKHIHERRATKRISSMVSFFNTVELSCQETTILTLSKLLIAQDNSITIPYLLNHAEQNPSAYPNTKETLLPDVIDRHKVQLDSLVPLIHKVKHHRDRTIAHLDKLHVSNLPAITDAPKLDYSEVEKVFRALQDVISEYGSFLEPPFVPLLRTLEPDVIEDIEYLTQLIEQDDLKE